MRILIADDHRLIVEGVKLKLSELGPDVEFQVASDVAALERILDGDQLPDVALIDVAMPGARGIGHIRDAHQHHPELAIMVLSGSEDPGVLHQLLDLGISGFVPKSYSPEVMLSAVKLVLAGGIYIPPMALNASNNHQAVATPEGDTDDPDRADDILSDRLHQLLTERQMDVLQLLSQGKPNKLIARELGISEGTVKIHLAAIFRALKVRNRVEAVVAAQHLGQGER